MPDHDHDEAHTLLALIVRAGSSAARLVQGPYPNLGESAREVEAPRRTFGDICVESYKSVAVGLSVMARLHDGTVLHARHLERHSRDTSSNEGGRRWERGDGAPERAPPSPMHAILRLRLVLCGSSFSLPRSIVASRGPVQCASRAAPLPPSQRCVALGSRARSSRDGRKQTNKQNLALRRTRTRRKESLLGEAAQVSRSASVAVVRLSRLRRRCLAGDC